MNKELCFCIEGREVYLKQVLVDYSDIPIFFICEEQEQNYLVLCTDIEEFNYIVIKISMIDTYNLLHGNIAMRDVFLKQKEYWQIISGEEISLDEVTKFVINEIDLSVLPEAGACFKILTEEIEKFVEKFDSEFLASKYFSENEKQIDFPEVYENETVILQNINKEISLSGYRLGIQRFIEDVRYGEKVYDIDEVHKFLQISDIVGRWETRDVQDINYAA